MRTRTLLLAAALTAAGIAAVQAQSNVYSVNVVGYYNVVIPGGGLPNDNNRMRLVTLQLKANGIANPTLNNTVTNLPAGTLAHVWTLAGWSIPTEYAGDGTWETDYAVPYGKAFFLKNTAGSDITCTVVGEVMQGTLNNTYGTGYTPVGPMVPQAGGMTTVHNFRPTGAGDAVYVWGPGWSLPNEFVGPGDDDWESGQPNIPVGGGVMVSSPGGGTWSRTFSVP